MNTHSNIPHESCNMNHQEFNNTAMQSIREKIFSSILAHTQLDETEKLDSAEVRPIHLDTRPENPSSVLHSPSESPCESMDIGVLLDDPAMSEETFRQDPADEEEFRPHTPTTPPEISIDFEKSASDEDIRDAPDRADVPLSYEDTGSDDSMDDIVFSPGLNRASGNPHRGDPFQEDDPPPESIPPHLEVNPSRVLARPSDWSSRSLPRGETMNALQSVFGLLCMSFHNRPYEFTLTTMTHYISGECRDSDSWLQKLDSYLQALRITELYVLGKHQRTLIEAHVRTVRIKVLRPASDTSHHPKLNFNSHKSCRECSRYGCSKNKAMLILQRNFNYPFMIPCTFKHKLSGYGFHRSPPPYRSAQF